MKMEKTCNKCLRYKTLLCPNLIYQWENCELIKCSKFTSTLSNLTTEERNYIKQLLLLRISPYNLDNKTENGGLDK